MEEGEPYPVRALIVNATNPLLTYADTHRVFDALMGLDLLVVLDYYMTPTAMIADYVLPAAGAIERPVLQVHGGVANMGYGGPAAVEPYYERRTDYDVFRGLGLRLGQEDAWPEETLADAFAAQLARAGMDWDAFCQLGIYWQPPAHAKHELPGPDGRPQGFATTTGKIELASEFLPTLGGPRLPEPAAPAAPLCSPELAAATWKREGGASPDDDHRLAQAAVQRVDVLQQPCLPRRRRRCPVAEVSPATAERCGLAAGDHVDACHRQGRGKVYTEDRAPMRDGLVNVDYGWWHPEWDAGRARISAACGNANVNCLTSCSVEDGRGDDRHVVVQRHRLRDPTHRRDWSWDANCRSQRARESSRHERREGDKLSMTEKKQALLLFSKPPVPGMVKTRLTTKHGGFLSEVAGGRVLQTQPVRRERAGHARASGTAGRKRRGWWRPTRMRRQDHLRLLRVHHAGGKRGAHAARPTTPLARGPWRYTTSPTRASTFDDHFDDAFRQIFALGYEQHRVGGRRHSHHAEVAHPAGVRSGWTTSKASARRASCRRPARNAARRWWASAATRRSTIRASTTT